MSRRVKSKQSFVTSAVKLALDKELISKTQDSVRVDQKELVTQLIMEKNILAGRKDEMKKKKGLK